MQWVALILVMAIIYVVVVLAVQYWPVTVFLLVTGGAIYTANKNAKREKAAKEAARQRRLAEQERQRKAQEAEREAALQRRLTEQVEQERQRKAQEAERLAYEQLQKSIRASLTKLSADSLKLLEGLPKRLMNAEELLDVAEAEFSEGAFAPFWDSIERATRIFGQFDVEVQAITTNSRRYRELTTQSHASPPPFPVGPATVEAMKTANTSVFRLGAVVRRAQRNFQFAIIFEQRRTNQILVAGFGNLAQAIDGMGSRVSLSIEALGSQVSYLGSTVEDSFVTLDSSLKDYFSELHSDAHDLGTIVSEQVESLRGVVQAEARGTAEGQERILQVLDNLNRRHRP